ncbi:calmodulin-binding transcription activator 1 isoform X10 [Betta splendens]|uniref:Calmodulin-binding transcription activator 1 n=1 Tax=Betta splendens TaxID=158456 RepID=A0A9W2XW83_BETSP|nr:calmodulin-binding transcription activator 1 isoform X10 [Betta splendens]
MAAENKPEGLKKVRNPDRMYRSGVCYAGHGPPKSISDDTEMNNEHGHLKIYLPKKLLECLPKCTSLPKERHRWNTNEEIAAYLITFEKHEEWLTTSPKTRPQNGSMILYNRKKVKYRKDGYCWKKRKDGKTTREDHMKLKVQGVECLYGCYVHSSIIPTFHRRCYWLLQNPDIVLVHYLNVPAIEDCGKPCGPILCSINTDKKEWAKWTKEELIGQLKPMFHGIKWTCSNGNSSSGFSVEQLVQQILDSHQTKPPPRTHNCLCTGTLGAGSSVHHKCNSAKHRIISPKVDPRAGGYGSAHSEVQNNDVSEGKTEHNAHGGGKGGGGGGGREKRNGKVHKPVLLHQNSTEVSSTNQVEVPDTTQNSPVSISSGLNSDPDMADSPAVAGMGHVASVMSGLSQSVFMSEVAGDPVYSMSPTGAPNAHLMGADAASQGLVLSVGPDRHKFAFPGGGVGEPGSNAAGDAGLSMLTAAGVSEELVLSSSLVGGSLKIPEATMNFDPDCFLNNPKQGQTYGGSALKTEGGSSSASSSSGSGGANGSLQRSPAMADNGYAFNSALVKNIKTEDTSFEQQLAKEGGYQVGAAASCGGGAPVPPGPAPGPGGLTLAAAGSLLPSGGGLSPSTTLEQMDFSAIDAKQDYASSAAAVGYGQAMSSPHMQHQSRSPSFFLQDASQGGQNQGRPGMGQKTHMMEHNSHDAGAYMGLQVVKTDSPGSNGHLHHHHQAHQTQHRANCNGGSPAEGSGPAASLQLLQYQGTFPGLGTEHEEAVGLEQPGSVSSGAAGPTENGAENLLKPGDHIQSCGTGNGEGEHYLQQASDGGGGGGPGGEGVALHNGGNGGDGASRAQQQQQQQQLQPLLQGTGMIQGLYNAVATHQVLGGASSNGGTGGTGMEISLDHFDISFGNQFSDLINDFISVDGSGAAMSAGAALYAHQLVTAHGSDNQNPAGGPTQQGQEDGGPRGSGYSPSELCLQPCCSPQSLSGGAGAGANAGEAGSLSYMNVAEVVSAAVAQGALGMLQATGRLFMVTDYSPEWSYPEGGVKVLITGPWQEASSNYSCLFDQISVPASLIQPGVLRCYCPAHDTGLVTLQVAVSNQIISSSVVFEYKARALPSLPSSQHDWLSLDDNQFRMSILERLEQMERRMAEMASHQQPSSAGSGGAAGGTGGTGGGGGGGGGGGNNSQSQCVSGQTQAGSSFESRVVVVCEKMMSRACWAKSKHLIHSKTFRGMTLLHLAAGQGYATLIQTLIKWRTKHADSIDLELEVDPLNVDHFSCTPLMWACALGHLEAAVVLYKWDRRALAIPDSLGRLPLSIARSRGHTKLAECLEQLQREEQHPPAPLPPTTRMSFSPAPDAPTSDSWMVNWTNDSVVAPSVKKGGSATTTTTSCSTSLNPDLRRPRSEPSNYYSSEGQRDLPLAKKHKPNPELFQTRPDKAMSVPLSLEQQQLHKLSSSPKSLSSEGLSTDKSLPAGGGTGTARWTSHENFSSGSMGRKALGVSGSSSLGKEKLISRLRQREQLGMLVMADREMADAELLSYREDLENQDCLTQMDDLQVNMMTLAEHIIEATPERIKRENFTSADSVPLDTSGVSNTMNWLANYLGDVEQLPSIIHLRSLYNEPLTPSSNPNLSPGGSPLREGPLERSSLPSPADWSEFINASNSKVERDLAQLTLSDPEQRELYEAARLVQTAFRKYKGRPLREQQEVAAAVIQRCYKKYKQLTWIALKYALYKKMTQAAILIQSKFRSYHEQKKFQQSRRAAVLIQQYYRSYKEFGRLRSHQRGAAAALVQHKLRGSLLTKRQDQAARKIMRFLRRCRHSPLMDHRLFKRVSAVSATQVKELKKAREHETPKKSPLAI